MKIKFNKSLFKKIALALAGVAALGLLAWGVKAIVDYTKNDLKTISPGFEVGNLGSDGKFVDDESTLYTKEAFGCYGLQVKPDFDSTVNYQIFYYDILDNYISSTEVLSDGYSGEAPINGAYARIVIEPRDDEDGKISFTEKIKYPLQLTVKVKKEQDINNRFVVIDGRVMQCVYDLKDVIFTNNLDFNLGSFTWNENSRNCITSTTFLKVSGGSTLTYDFSRLGENFSDSKYFIAEFSGFPEKKNLITSPVVMLDNSVVLDKKTQYILISVNTYSSSVFWSETEISKMSACFSITKN